MNHLEAKSTLETLARGVDPATGEILSEQSPFNMRSAEKSGRQHSVELRNGGIDEPNPQSRIHEGIS